MPDESIEKVKYFINQSSSFSDDKPIQLGDIRMATTEDGSFSMKTLVVDLTDDNYVQVCGVHTYPEMQSDQDVLIQNSSGSIFPFLFIQKDVQFYVWKHQLGVSISSLSEEEIISATDKVGSTIDATFDARFYFKQEQISIAMNLTKSCSSHLLQLQYQNTIQDEED